MENFKSTSQTKNGIVVFSGRIWILRFAKNRFMERFIICSTGCIHPDHVGKVLTFNPLLFSILAMPLASVGSPRTPRAFVAAASLPSFQRSPGVMVIVVGL